MERLRRGHGGSYADRLVNRWARIRRRIFSSSSSLSSSLSSSRSNIEDDLNSNVPQISTAESQPRTFRDPECEALFREYEEAKKRNAEVHRQYEQEKEKFKEEMRKRITRIDNDTNRVYEKLSRMKAIHEESHDTIIVSSDDEATQILGDSDRYDEQETSVEEKNEPLTPMTKTQKIIASDWKLRAECRVKRERIVPPKKKPTIRNVQIVKSKFRIAKDRLIKLSKEELRKLAKNNNKDREGATSAPVTNEQPANGELQVIDPKIEKKNDNSEEEIKELVAFSRSDKALRMTREYYDCINAIKRERGEASEEYIAIEEIEVVESDQCQIEKDKNEQDENNNRESSLTQPVSKLAIDGVSLDSHDKPEGGMQPVCEALPDPDSRITPSKDEIEDLEALLAE